MLWSWGGCVWAVCACVVLMQCLWYCRELVITALFLWGRESFRWKKCLTGRVSDTKTDIFAGANVAWQRKYGCGWRRSQPCFYHNRPFIGNNSSVCFPRCMFRTREAMCLKFTLMQLHVYVGRAAAAANVTQRTGRRRNQSVPFANWRQLLFGITKALYKLTKAMHGIKYLWYYNK